MPVRLLTSPFSVPAGAGNAVLSEIPTADLTAAVPIGKAIQPFAFAVAPTFIETPLTAPMFEDEVFGKFVLDRIPMGKIGSTVDVANAVVYLASDASALVTGTSLKVDGGWTAQ